MASSLLLHGKEEIGGYGFVMDKNSLAEQSKKANWGNDLIFGSYGSSSSGLSSPFGSELGSTETDESESQEDEDFIAELTRQMADYMLKDDDEQEKEKEKEEVVSVEENDSLDENIVPNTTPSIPQTSNPWALAGTWSNYDSGEICYYNQESLSTYVKPMTESSADQVKSFNTGFYSSDDLKRPIQVYNLKDQPTIVKQRSSNSKGKRVKGTTAAEPAQKLNTEKKIDQNNNLQNSFTKKQTLGGHGHHPIQGTGAGMRAVFLGGPGSINGSFGTGVFLPRSINPTATAPKKNNPSATAPQKKSGSSTVLIPARVLQALQLHYNHMDALSQSHTCAVSPTHHLPKYEKETKEYLVSNENDQASGVNDQDLQLPQEWTY